MDNSELLFNRWSKEIEGSIINSNSLSVAFFRTDGSLIFANKAIKVLFGDSESPVKSILNPSFENLLKKDISEGVIYSGYVTFGDYSSVNSSIWADIYRINDEIMIIGGVDSTQLMHQNIMMHNLNREIGNLQRELIKEKHSLKEANATKDKFFSIIAHDLKNPFNVLIGLSDIMKEGIRTMEISEIEEMLEMISQTSNSTYSLLEDLLLWSKNHLGKLSYSPKSIHFSEIWHECSDTVKAHLAKKEIKLQLDIKDNIKLFCDKNMTKTIFRNLISNSIKFSYPGSTVTVKVESRDNYALIAVQDKGVGMTQEKVAKLWKVGNQISTKGTEDESGTGLGLILCKEFVEIHGGKIWVESTPEKGSTFYFTVPIAKEKS